MADDGGYRPRADRLGEAAWWWGLMRTFYVATLTVWLVLLLAESLRIA
jgi:hypothetical protein